MSYPPPPPPEYGYGYGGGYVAPRSSQKAVWALVLGILGLICCGYLAGIPALILGLSAKKDIAVSGGALTGRGMAQAGIVLGIIAIVVGVIGTIFAIGNGAFSGSLSSN
jgi:hypothetical protein